MTTIAKLITTYLGKLSRVIKKTIQMTNHPTNTTSCTKVSVEFTKKTEHITETTKHKTVNNILVNNNKVLTMLWKLSQDHAPFIHKTGEPQDKRIILYEGSKLEHEHTRKTLATLSWVYKHGDHPIVIRGGSPCWS